METETKNKITVNVADWILSGATRKSSTSVKERKVWSIGLSTVLIPFFTAQNAVGFGQVPHDALGAPLRLARDKDTGEVRFAKNGKPIWRVAPAISEAVKLQREDMIAGMVTFASNVAEADSAAYAAEVSANLKAGQPIIERDKQNEAEAIAKAVKAEAKQPTNVMAEAEAIIKETDLIPA